MSSITSSHGFRAPASVPDVAAMIRSEYLEMPGLCLTRAQVQRYWVLDPAVCDRALEALVAAGVLRLTAAGYVRS